ncbi:uncharacterized protein LOC114521884 [Dendronephthya gigantea]|uniref:uncharacterized protein LOC114521884 n=1 Tax=Dendronephthya gigantea TaxID=151771 RepID=UPI00106A1F44|nr:uncharacterized protein LOC114521884 [Dendronephthya gigantea]
MNKLFVAVFVVAIGASYGFLIDNIPFLCKVDKDCGAHKCCAFGRVCLPKIGANLPCGGRLGGIHKCGCDDGLECKVTQVITVTVADKEKVVKIRQCRASEEVVVPREVKYNAEPGKKRFLSSVTNGITGAFDKLFRKCSASSECGNNRCCSNSVPFWVRCILQYPEFVPCHVNSHCCASGLECRSVFDVTTGPEGGPTKKPIEVKMCRKITDPVEPPTEVEVDE